MKNHEGVMHKRLMLATEIVRLIDSLRTDTFGASNWVGWGGINWNFAIVNLQTDNLAEMIYEDAFNASAGTIVLAQHAILRARQRIADFLAERREIVSELILCGSKYDPPKK